MKFAWKKAIPLQDMIQKAGVSKSQNILRKLYFHNLMTVMIVQGKKDMQQILRVDTEFNVRNAKERFDTSD